MVVSDTDASAIIAGLCLCGIRTWIGSVTFSWFITFRTEFVVFFWLVHISLRKVCLKNKMDEITQT